MEFRQTWSMPAHNTCPRNIIAAYNNGEYSDLKITCGKLTFNVHKLVVCSTCDFIKHSLSFMGREAEERCINLPDDDPEMIHRLITYLYQGDYEPCNSSTLGKFWQLDLHDPPKNTLSAKPHQYMAFSDGCACLIRDKQLSSGSSKEELRKQVAKPLSIHAEMYGLGEKYQVAGLSYLAMSKFKSCLSHHWNTVDFINAVQTTYSSTPECNRGLRDVVVQAFRDYFGTDLMKDPTIETKLDTIDELSFALLKSWPHEVRLPDPKSAKGSSATSSTADIHSKALVEAYNSLDPSTPGRGAAQSGFRFSAGNRPILAPRGRHGLPYYSSTSPHVPTPPGPLAPDHSAPN